MYNKKEWVNDEIITKEDLNNIENGIADLDAKMNDVATKKELQAIENDIAENNNELNDLKKGLVASLVAQGHTVNVNSSWKDLFDILSTGSGSVPDVPNPDDPEDSGEGILLYKAGTQYNNTEFRNLCLTNAANSLTSNAICYDLNVSKPHVWFSYDGFINFDDYVRVEITAYTENSSQQPTLGLGITSKSGQCGYDGSARWDGTPHTDLTLMYNVTKTKYSLPINYTGSGYLLIWMNHANSALGRVYITEIRVIPKKTENDEPIEIIDDEITIQVGEKYDATRLYKLQSGYNVQYKYSSIIAIEGEHTIVGKEVGTTELEIICGGIIKTVTVNVVIEDKPGGIVLLSDGEYFNDTEFGSLCATPGVRDFIDNNGALVYELNTVFTTAFFSFGDTDDHYVNFNNYDAVELTVYTENNNQVPYIQVCRVGGSTNSPSGQYGYGNTAYPVNIMEHTGFYVNTKKVPTVYTVNMAELRKASADMGSLLFIIERGNDSNTADGKVYISKIVVYPEGTYYTESIDE